MSEKDWYDYEMSEALKAEFTKNKMAYFLEELKVVFAEHLDGIEPTMFNFVFHVAGTYGWNDAFKKTCINYGLEDILAYYNKLTWYDSDRFDADFCSLLTEYGLIEEGDFADLSLAIPDEEEAPLYAVP